MKMSNRAEPIHKLQAGAPATPALASLRLDEEALASLALQGFVRSEWRGQRGPYYRLRFRVGRRQRSKYLGQDAAFAAQVRKEIAELQAPRRLDLELHQVSRQARQLCRRNKVLLEAGVRAQGCSFHGLHVRLPASIPKPAARSAVTADLVLIPEVRSMSDTNSNRSDNGADDLPAWPDVLPRSITPAAPGHGKPPDVEVRVDPLADDPVQLTGNRFPQQLEQVLGEVSELSSLLAQGIKSAMRGNCSEVKHFGRLPEAYGSYSGLLRQFGSLGQLKMQLDKASEN